MNLDVFKNILKNLYTKDMCYYKLRDEWNSGNPYLGMCAISSLLVNEYFGFSIGKIKVDGISHYFNINGNDIIDVTSEQFDSVSYDGYVIVDKDEILKDEDTLKRYNLLKSSFINHFKDDYYIYNVFGNIDDDIESINSNINDILPKFRFAVVTILKDRDDNLILQRRGAKARDEFNRLEEIGGAVEDTDSSFRDAIIREIREEVGDKANIKVNDLVGGFICTKYDLRTEDVISWLFLLYESDYIDGELKVMEPTKCIGYEKYKIGHLPIGEMSKSSRLFNQYYQEYKFKV